MAKKQSLEEDIMEVLLYVRDTDKDRWAIFFLGIQLYIGSTHVYASYKNAKNRILYSFRFYHSTKKVAIIVDKLLEQNILQIKQVKDRSLKYPYNITGISKEQADRLASMVDAQDEEMVQLAITMIKGIKDEQVQNRELGKQLLGGVASKL